MAKHPLVSAAELDEADWTFLTEATDRLENTWASRADPELGQFVPDKDHPLRLRVLIELIKVDQEYRFRAGQRAMLAAWIAQWPELDEFPEAVRELVEHECLTRAVFGQIPPAEEIRERFPELIDRIDLAAIAAEAERERGSAGAEALPLVPGQRFGRYEIRGRLGRGGMGTVYRALDTQLGREVALKIPHVDPADEPAVLERFVREAQAAAKIRHANICPTYDSGQINGTYFITMALIQGQSLRQRLEDRPPDPCQAAEFVGKLALALEEVHRAGIVHRDLKPSNVMIDRNGEPVLMDFGLAREMQADTHLTNTGSFAGTIPYMSPQQAAGKPADVGSDVYSLGVLFYQLLTGELPFSGPPVQLLVSIARSQPPKPSNLCKGLDPTLESICLRAMAKRPADRYQSAAELADALDRYLQGLPQLSSPPSRRRRVKWIVAAAGAVLGLTAFAMFAFFSSRRLVGIERWIETTTPVGGICLSPDGSTLYAASHSDDKSPIEVFDVSSGNPLHRITFGDQHGHGNVVVSPDGRYLFTTNYYQRYMTRIDLRADNAAKKVKIGTAREERWARGIEMTPDGRRLVVLVGQDGRTNDLKNDYMSILDVADGKLSVLSRVPLKDEVVGFKIGFSSDGRFAYVVTRGRGPLVPSLYECRLTEPYEVTRTLPFPNGDLAGVAVSDKLHRVFVSDRSHRRISVVDLDQFKTVSSIELDRYKPEMLAINRQSTLLVALCPESRKLFCVDPVTEAIVGEGGGLREAAGDVEFSADGLKLFVSHRGSQGGVAVVALDRLSRDRIVFASDRAGGSYQIYVMDADGRNMQPLTDNRATNRFPRWSPDGRSIAFLCNALEKPKIYVDHGDGAGALPLRDTDPVMDKLVCGAPLDWSADGTEIAFIGNGHKAIRIVVVETGKIRTLIDGEVGRGYAEHHGLCWRKTDGAILFTSQDPASGHNRDLFSLDPRTGALRQLTRDWGKPAHSMAPASSPDGKKIAVVRLPNGDPPPSGIFLMNADGTGLTQLRAGGSEIFAAVRWFPDGSRIVYSSRDTYPSHVYAVDAAGGEPTQLTGGGGNHVDPDVCRSLPVIARTKNRGP